jgi:bifunctional non-homologous end joining protein LigD
MAADKLSTYVDMRDFSLTPEPSGGTPVKPSARPRFVVQKHAATRLHYDFRLEHEGVFLSWAVTKGPSLNPEDKRLAVETEPHPLDYGDFEGVIPKGQYGGGTVMLWDRGYWSPDPAYSVEAGLKKGHLHVTLDGGRMKGGWHLIRLKGDRNARGKAASRTNWLLFKGHDDQADPEHADALVQMETSIASGRTLEAIAAGTGKAPKPFMTAPTRKPSAKAVWTSKVAEAHPEPPAPPPAPRPKPARARRTESAVAAMPGFIPPQLCRSVDRPPAGGGWGHEIKLDGYRVQLHVRAGKSTCYSRSGLDWTERFRDVASEAARLPDCIVDSEVVALDEHGRPDFPALQAALSEGRSDRLIAFCFDLLWVNGEDLRDQPLRARKARLEDVLEHQAPSGSSRLRYVDHFEAAGEAVLQSACSMELEGVVSKKLDAPYLSGRSETWTKAKCRGGQEVVIGGWTGTETTLRSLLCGLYRGEQFIYVGRVGTGFTQASAAALAAKLAAIESAGSPFGGPGAPKKSGDMRWCRPELVAEVQYAGWTGAGSLRQASFKGLREDKPAREVVKEETPLADEPEAPPPAKVAAPRSTGAKTPVAVRGVGISNPDKPLWPAHADEPAVTKADLARYLDAVGAAMLPHYAGRPISVVRTPDGIEAERFFQRHAMPGTSSLIQLIEVGDRKPYITTDSVEGLIAIAQTGGAELHPWNCLPGQVDVPGRLVFDLDPAEDVPFNRVVEAAKEIRDRLSALGLEGFLKTTGGKGLHVTTPLKPKRGSVLSWPEAKAFAQNVCRMAAADSPDAYTTTMAKRARPGKIFLDYLRNDRMATAVGPLSPRARPGATVSLPITWAQATARLDPAKYTIRTVPALLRKGDAWAGYDEAARPLQDAIKRLEKAAPNLAKPPARAGAAAR